MPSSWQPSATISRLRQRAEIMRQIRDFFHARHYLEVETPLLCRTTVTDPYIQSIPAFPGLSTDPFYLQTSPEYAMKRLLASGSGSIFQISKAFRLGDLGRHHQPEFTLLEWYHIDVDHHQLMDEMDELLQLILRTDKADRISYGKLFQDCLGIDPHTATLDILADCAEKNSIQVADDICDCTTWLHLLLTHCIEPQLGNQKPCFIYDFPIAQSALARVQTTSPPVASRFEVYFNGLELANGFHELNDANEQRLRFEINNMQRAALGLPPLRMDELLLSALSYGLPACSGVALGIDRLVMLATGESEIASVISFDFSRV